MLVDAHPGLTKAMLPKQRESGMIFQVVIPGAEYATIIVRAPSEAEARKLALEEYSDYGDFAEVKLVLLDPTGPAEVLIEDWS
jgi:hypothetical protein